jgi:hypothetical protein
MRPYSIAVAPLSSFTKSETSFIFCPRCVLLA